MGTLRIYSLNNFPVYQTAVLTVANMLYIASPVLIYLIAGSLYLLLIFFQFPLPPVSHLWQPQI